MAADDTPGTPAPWPEPAEVRAGTGPGPAELHGAEVEGLLAALGDGVLIYDTDRRVRRVNPAFLETFGLDPTGLQVEEIIRLLDCRRPGGRPLPAEELPTRRALRGERAGSMRFQITTPDGREREVETSSGPLRHEGRIIGSVTVWREVTVHARADRALADAARRKSEFLALLSHELRNPLAAIRASLELLKRSPPPGPAVEVIDRQAGQLERLVDDLLDTTRIETGKLELERQRLEAGQLVRHAVDDQRTVLEARGLALRLDLPARPCFVEADAARLAQVVGNLLHNASKFTPPGGAVMVRLAEEGGEVVLSVRDTGQGIDPALLPQLFQPFVQGAGRGGRGAGGLGLGLALVRGLVALHGGRVAVRSEGPGRGTEVVVRLPSAGPGQADQPRPTRPAPPGPGLQVLLIEDNADVAAAMAELLASQGHQVEVAPDGRSGTARARDLRPDVVVCDLGLPDQDGCEVARALRAEPGLAATRLLALSGHGGEEDRRRASQAGFDEHLLKPASLEQLQAAMTRGR
jgi:PAS domain S-box-containing protein